MILKFNVKEQTISPVNTKSVPRIGSKDYLVLQFSFSSDWENLDKLVYLQSGDVSQPINIVDNLVEVPEWFTEQNSFNVTLFGTGGTTEVPTNVVSVQLEKSNDLWVKDAPEPTPSWITKLIDLSNHPPIPGSNGYWLLWDTDRNKYTESQLPLPEQVQSDWNQNDDTQPDYIKNKPLIVISFKPAGKSYLTFSSPSNFTLKVNDATKHWDGALEYFASDKTWTVWDGTTTLSAVDDDGEYVLYLRGTGNTKIGYYDYDTEDYIPWVINGTDVRCNGNIETLLDYATVEAGQHPTMADECFIGLFKGCIALSQAPVLPATTLATSCYDSMFRDCTALTQAPALPATTLANNCYNSMFYGCKGLTQAPALPATTLKVNCYNSMFRDCTSLTKAPSLPATTLANNCYRGMFQGCTDLANAPALPVTTLANWCYIAMFYGCTSLKLSSTQTGEYTQEYRIPSSGEGVTARDALTDMFTSTGGTFTGTPDINTTYYLSSDNMIVRETEIDTLNGYVGSMIDVAIAEHTSNPLNIAGATVGQIAKITAVDENGKPTEWEAVDMASGGGEEALPMLYHGTIVEAITNAEFTEINGNPISLSEVKVWTCFKSNKAEWCGITISTSAVNPDNKTVQIGTGGKYTDAEKLYVSVVDAKISDGRFELSGIKPVVFTAYYNTSYNISGEPYVKSIPNITYSSEPELQEKNVYNGKINKIRIDGSFSRLEVIIWGR